MARRKTTATNAAMKWRDRMSNAGAAIEAGVNAVTEAPGKLAAAQKANWLARITASADKWAQRTGAVTLQKWKDSTIQKGIPRIATGVEMGAANYQSWLEAYLPMIQGVTANLGPKQKGNIGNAMSRIQKVLEATQKFAATYQKRPGT